MTEAMRTIPRIAPIGAPVWEIAELFPEQGSWSEKAYLALESNRLVEFDNGMIEVLPMPKKLHQIIMLFLAELLKAYFAARSGGGLVLVAGYKIRIPGGKYRDPDVLYMTGEQNARSNEDFTDQAELVMEVVSPDDPNRDYVRKRVDYALAGIPEYWIVDPLQARIVVLTLFDGAYVEHGTFVSGQIVTSNRFPGLSVAVDEVWKLRH